jgi:hypothetical protein
MRTTHAAVKTMEKEEARRTGGQTWAGQSLLLVTGLPGADACRALLGQQLGMEVTMAAGLRAALALLRRREYAVVVLDETQMGADPAGAESFWDNTGMAVPVQINLAISGCGRVVRTVRAALQRREREQALALRAAIQAVEGGINNTVAGLLLQTQLALADPAVPPSLLPRLQQVAQLAGSLRQQLGAPTAP